MPWEKYSALSHSAYLVVSLLLRKVFAYDFDLASGSVSNKRVAVNVDPKHGVSAFVLLFTQQLRHSLGLC